MQYPRFANCIELLNTPIEHLSPGNPEESPLLGTSEEIAAYYLDLVTIELEDELGNKNTPEQMGYMIKLYVSRLMKSKNHRSVKDTDPLAENKVAVKETGSGLTRVGTLLIADIPHNPNHEVRFRNGCNILYHLLFDEVQKSCLMFDIPFMKICNELNFDLDSINTEYYSKNVKHQSKSAPDEPGTFIHAKKALVHIPEPDNEKIFSDIKNSDNLFWRGLPMEFVIKHFIVFTLKKSSNKNVFLTEEQFISFLRRGFLKETKQPVQKFNCASREKGMIIKTFYLFYNIAVSQYACPLTKEVFINLFTDCFNNWDPSTIKDFFRPGKVRKQL